MAYLDHAATTPMLPEALEAYVAAAREVGNASSLHGPGRLARKRVEESRERIAAALGARPSEVIFTSGGTESDNLAVKGIFWARRDSGKNRILASAAEHHAVLDAVHWLTDHEKAAVTWLPVDSLGQVDFGAVEASMDDDVALMTVMWANNEVGTLQPIPELAALGSRFGVPVHTDAIQAIGHVPVNYGASGVSAMSVTGHKLGGPQGVGALLLGRDVKAAPLFHGGGQERDVRSGTLDVAGIVAFSTAVDHVVGMQQQESSRLSRLRDELIKRVYEAVPDAVFNGSPDNRLPNNAHFSFPGCEGDALLLLLDAAKIAVSTGSACSAGVAQPSHVLLAMGTDPLLARSSLRFTLGHTSTADDIDALITALPSAVERARRAGQR
jgi:cysteine desulfurase